MIYLILLTGLLACSNQTIDTFDIKALLPQKTSTVVIYENVIIENPRLLELQNTFTKSIQENYDWFVEYGKKNDLPLPYHKNMGLTKSEYDELQRLYENAELKLQETGKEKMKVSYKDNSIHFSSSGTLEFFNQISVNLSDSTIQMVDNTLQFQRTDTVNNVKNVFKSRWIGYTWTYNYPENFEFLSSEYMKTGLVKSYTFTIGRLETTGKTFIKIKGVEMNNGEKYVDFDAPIIFE
jgi:hypothetical protein